MIIEFADRAEHWNDDKYIVTVEKSGVVSVTKMGQISDKRIRVYKNWISIQTDDAQDAGIVYAKSSGDALGLMKRYLAAGGK